MREICQIPFRQDIRKSPKPPAAAGGFDAFVIGRRVPLRGAGQLPAGEYGAGQPTGCHSAPPDAPVHLRRNLEEIKEKGRFFPACGNFVYKSHFLCYNNKRIAAYEGI